MKKRGGILAKNKLASFSRHIINSMNFYGAKQLQYVNESNGPQTETLTYNLLGSLAMQHIFGVYVAMKKVCFAPFVA